MQKRPDFWLQWIFNFNESLTEPPNDNWYKRWCDYGGSDNRCARDYRCKIILYWIFLIKTSFNKTGGWFVSWDNYVDITVGIYMRKVAHRNSEATIQKFSLK